MLKWRKAEKIPWKVIRRAEKPLPNFPRAWTVASSVAACVLALATTVQAGSPMSMKIAKAFNPLIELAQAVSYPVCFLMVTGGFMLIMTGNRERGMVMIRNAAIGYIGLQFVPAIMLILIEVGKAMMQ